MRTRLSILAAAFVLFLGCQTQPDAHETTDAPASPAAFDTVTVTGTLIDATCHTRDVPPSECEGQYVAQGYPVGLRPPSDDDLVWILVMVPQAVGDYLTSTARVTGVVRSKGVLVPHRMEVKNGQVWTSVM
jgi:hypothetical protein